ncbi:hypothetical protein PMI07_006382 [Rhizobium sp. CF080]|nr:hypothetical protein PMI07_006382 [Rhizobium sp. CF080]
MVVPRANRKAVIKFGDVACPVALYTAASSSECITFTQNHVVGRYAIFVTGDEVKKEGEVKGDQRGGDEYIIPEGEELENVALDGTKTIYISKRLSGSLDAMESHDMVGISRLVMTRRERAVMLEPRDNGIALWTLRYGEVRDEDTLSRRHWP